MTEPQEPSKRTQRRRVREWWQAIDADLPAELIPLEAIVCIKALDADGEVCLYTKKTKNLSVWEAFGMLSYALDDYSSATTQFAATEEDE